MKYQKDVGYGHTLDISENHYLVHDKEDGKHYILNKRS